MNSSGLYRGLVVHARRRPKRHRLAYRIFQLLLDLDEVDAIAGQTRLFSIGRWNLFGFDPGDHLEGPGRPLTDQVRALAAQAGIDLVGGRILLLAMPRVLGHAFNPLSLYFCEDRGGRLTAILHEVNNTFGERHVYVLPVAGRQAERALVEQACRKEFFVSPFMSMAVDYRFRILPPGETVQVDIRVDDAEGELLAASFDGKREEITDRALLRAWLGAPLLSLKVLGAIHWEALRIFLKGVGLQRRTPSRGLGVTVVRPADIPA